MLNDVLQIAGVAIALIISAVWVVRRVRHRHDKKGCADDSGCAGCSLAEHCGKKDNRKR